MALFGQKSKKLPGCDELFVKYLSPWYFANEKPTGTRPDMYVIAGYEGQTLDMESLQYLNEEYLNQTIEQIEKITAAALQDYKEIVNSDKLDFNVLDAVDKYYDRKKIREIIENSDPTDYSNLYLVSICEFGATIGQLFRDFEGYDWLYSHPYFHSIIVHKETGLAIAVFDWAVKKFSEYGVDDGFVAKIRAAIEAVDKHSAEK